MLFFLKKIRGNHYCHRPLLVSSAQQHGTPVKVSTIFLIKHFLIWIAVVRPSSSTKMFFSLKANGSVKAKNIRMFLTLCDGKRKRYGNSSRYSPVSKFSEPQTLSQWISCPQFPRISSEIISNNVANWFSKNPPDTLNIQTLLQWWSIASGFRSISYTAKG